MVSEFVRERIRRVKPNHPAIKGAKKVDKIIDRETGRKEVEF